MEYIKADSGIPDKKRYNKMKIRNGIKMISS